MSKSAPTPSMARGPKQSSAPLEHPSMAGSTVRAGVRIREVPAVRRAAAILRHLAGHADGLTMSAIARELDIIPSTCLHILRELMSAHLVAFEPRGKTYRLGLGLLLLAKELSSNDVFIQASQAELAAFAQEHGVSISAQQRDGEHVVIVAAVTASEGLEAPLGRRVAVLSAAGGRLFAAHGGWTPAQLRTRFDRVRWQSPPDFDHWLSEVEEAKSSGYAIDSGNFRLGVTSIAAGVITRDRHVWGAVSINVVSAQLDSTRVSELIEGLKQTSANIAAALH